MSQPISLRNVKMEMVREEPFTISYLSDRITHTNLLINRNPNVLDMPIPAEQRFLINDPMVDNDYAPPILR